MLIKIPFVLLKCVQRKLDIVESKIIRDLKQEKPVKKMRRPIEKFLFKWNRGWLNFNSLALRLLDHLFPLKVPIISFYHIGKENRVNLSYSPCREMR